MPTLKAAFETATQTYVEETHPKLRMLDNLILLSLATFGIQVVYGILFNRDPFTSFIAGVFCSLGVFGLSTSLRIQLTDKSFNEAPKRRLVIEYIVGCWFVFFASLLLMDDR